MAASSNEDEAPPRRHRYERVPTAEAVPLSPRLIAVLVHLATFGILTLAQLAGLTNLTYKQVRRLVRAALDGGWVKVHALPRHALLGAEARVLGGSGPNVYTLSPRSWAALKQRGLLGEDQGKPADVSERGFPFLGHTLALHDLAVYLTRCGRAGQGAGLFAWREGAAAVISLERAALPREARPDSWFIYGLGTATLVGLVEIDRGTERLSGPRWRQKMESYAALYASGRLPAVTGYANARLLVLAPDPARREALARHIAEQAAPALCRRVWLTQQESLAVPDLTAAVWQQPGEAGLKPLVTAAQLSLAPSA